MQIDQTNIHPYSLDIIAPTGSNKSYQWALRKNGKLVQRSDRSLTSAEKAWENGLAQVEKLLAGIDR